MRIIAGRWRGRRLGEAPRGVRPTTDRVRERLFAVLGGSLPGGLAVDLFCGAGTLGLEALSRGAERCLFVDHSPRSLAALAKNLAALGVGEAEATLRREDARRFVQRHWPPGPVAWVFLDPPYGDPAGKSCLEALGDLDPALLGWVIWEGPAEDPPALPRLILARTLDFGDTKLTLWQGGIRP